VAGDVLEGDLVLGDEFVQAAPEFFVFDFL
jgi:hypothetical protein